VYALVRWFNEFRPCLDRVVGRADIHLARDRVVSENAELALVPVLYPPFRRVLFPDAQRPPALVQRRVLGIGIEADPLRDGRRAGVLSPLAVLVVSMTVVGGTALHLLTAELALEPVTIGNLVGSVHLLRYRWASIRLKAARPR